MLAYKPNEYPTVGVEQEFHLIDPATGDLVHKCDEVMEQLEPSVREKSTYELFESVLEWRSDPFRSVADLEKSVAEDKQTLSEACEKAGVRFVASACHPFARWRDQVIINSDHYNWVLEETDYVARRLLSFGLHVHVGLRSADAAVYVQNEMRRWLFPLMALSANSPYFEGELTGLASTRLHLFLSMPRTGIPPEFTSYEELEELYLSLKAAGDVMAPGDMWWCMRIQPPLGTLEMRCFDLPTSTRRLAAITALTQAAAAACQDRFYEGEKPTAMRRVLIEENQWNAMRYGISTDILDPATGEVVSTEEQIRRLLGFAEQKASELGSLDYFDEIESILQNGTESDLQVKASESFGSDLRKMELDLADKTL